eukprot:Gb_35275 [translate_table: standard]
MKTEMGMQILYRVAYILNCGTYPQKVVLEVPMSCLKCKRQAMKTVAVLKGINSIEVNMEDQKVTVIGDADPVDITSRLRKFRKTTQLLSVGPPTVPKKPDPEKPKPDPLPIIYVCHMCKPLYICSVM